MNAQEINKLMKSVSEAECASLLREELTGPRRRTVALRIHSRFNRLRYLRERKEIERETTIR